jgi:hypothetical protein
VNAYSTRGTFGTPQPTERSAAKEGVTEARQLALGEAHLTAQKLGRLTAAVLPNQIAATVK